MKLPTEADLIEVENHVLKTWQIAEIEGGNRPYRIVRTLETLIALARDPSQLLKYIPFDDDALDRAMHPPRTSVLKVMPAARPKPKKKKR